MATFRKFDNQQVYQLHTSSVEQFKVGDVVSYNPAARTLTKVPTRAEALALLADQKELYLIAQSDAVTFKTGTAYKSKKLDEVVNGPIAADNVDSNNERTVVAYRIETLANVEGLPAEEDEE